MRYSPCIEQGKTRHYFDLIKHKRSGLSQWNTIYRREERGKKKEMNKTEKQMISLETTSR